MSEKTELHLYLDWGTPKEKIVTVEVSEERLDLIRELMDQKKLTLVQAFLQTSIPIE